MVPRGGTLCGQTGKASKRMARKRDKANGCQFESILSVELSLAVLCGCCGGGGCGEVKIHRICSALFSVSLNSSVAMLGWSVSLLSVSVVVSRLLCL